MVPKAQLIVYYMKDGEIISDTIDIEFGEELHNFVSFILMIRATLNDYSKQFWNLGNSRNIWGSSQTWTKHWYHSFH